MTDFEATLQQELSDFAKSELVAQTPEDGEQHDEHRLNRDEELLMTCPHCLSTSISKRQHRTSLGYRNFLLPSMSASLQRTHWFALQRSLLAL